MLKIRYLRNETSYEDIRHGVRKLKTPSFWTEKFCVHLVNRCCLNLDIGQNEKNGQKWLKLDLKMFKNTVLGYLKGDFQLFLSFSYESLKRLTVPYVRCLVSINTLAGRTFSRHTIHMYYVNFLLFSYFLQLLKTLFYKSYYSVS